MGRPKGSKNTKAYTLLDAAAKDALVADYVAGMKQTALAAKYGVAQTAVSKMLRARGTQMRSNMEAQPPTFDVAEAVRLFKQGNTTYAIADVVGVSQSVVYSHLKRQGVVGPR